MTRHESTYRPLGQQPHHAHWRDWELDEWLTAAALARISGSG